jgi:rare lipoprotein A
MAFGACQPSPQSRTNVSRGAPATPRGEALWREEPARSKHAPSPGKNSTVAEHPSVELERLRARYGSAPALTRFRGEVSYYSDALAGRPTASGEPYAPAAATAAHRSLPFGSVVRVVRDDTGQAVYVRINDRGPFVRGRVLDLSRVAASAIGVLGRGVARVTAEVVELGPKSKRKHKKKRKTRR